MKTRLLIAGLLMLCSTTFAQFSNSSNSSSSSAISTDGWNTFYVQWNPSTLNPDGGSSKSFTGLSVGFNKAISLTQTQPIFLELGIAAQYSFRNDTETMYEYNTGKIYSYDLDEKFSMVSAKIPVQLDYVWTIPNSTIDLVPNLSLDIRFNIIGKVKYEANGNSKSFNLFDKDDMEKMADYNLGVGETWNRFQIGWHIGVNAMFNKQFMVGVSYGTDFSEICKKCKVNTTSITIGLCI